MNVMPVHLCKIIQVFDQVEYTFWKPHALPHVQESGVIGHLVRAAEVPQMIQFTDIPIGCCLQEIL
jgi:hypothetical protein